MADFVMADPPSRLRVVHKVSTYVDKGLWFGACTCAIFPYCPGFKTEAEVNAFGLAHLRAMVKDGAPVVTVQAWEESSG